MDLDAYLRRIRLSRGASADFAYLRRLHRAHLRAIPYENLDVLLGLRWRRFSVQFGGLAKVGSGSDYAASLCSGLALSGASPG